MKGKIFSWIAALYNYFCFHAGDGLTIIEKLPLSQKSDFLKKFITIFSRHKNLDR